MTPMSNQTRPAAGPTTSSTACEPALSNFVTTPATEGGARSKKMSRQAYAPGKEWMQHRILDGGRYKACHGTVSGHIADSISHRYDREVGFERPNQEAIRQDVRMARFYEQRPAGPEKTKSHEQRVTRYSLLERYALEYHPEHSWVVYLRSLLADLEDPERMEGTSKRYLAPPSELVVTWCLSLREGFGGTEPAGAGGDEDERISNTGGLRASSIKTYVGGVTATCMEFGLIENECPTHCSDLSTKMTQWKDADDVDAATPFDMAHDMPKLWNANWQIPGWHQGKRIKVTPQSPTHASL